MLSIAHATTGALIATKIHNPLIAIPLIFISHYLEDAIPHWDVGQGLTKKLKRKKSAFLQELLIDFPASALLVYLFFQHGQTSFNYYAWFGWFVGLLPDFLEFPHLFMGWHFFPIEQLAKLHKYFHNSIPDKVRGLIPQVIVIATVYLLK